ncbi:hypothetical protein BJ508DRAFT_330385 [Ascobolus immersus RN42]|uniref:Uncharacterized protein n=1 Tax=Ascobolus immersus RN42 TaxID=1160509 RepID=A0A3N4HW16_ASCIM|nr:hypothetical protein BJ508DRAFT_330385 [Ascobolus immersus RN42]
MSPHPPPHIPLRAAPPTPAFRPFQPFRLQGNIFRRHTPGAVSTGTAAAPIPPTQVSEFPSLANTPKANSDAHTVDRCRTNTPPTPLSALFNQENEVATSSIHRPEDARGSTTSQTLPTTLKVAQWPPNNSPCTSMPPQEQSNTPLTPLSALPSAPDTVTSAPSQPEPTRPWSNTTQTSPETPLNHHHQSWNQYSSATAARIVQHSPSPSSSSSSSYPHRYTTLPSQPNHPTHPPRQPYPSPSASPSPISSEALHSRPPPTNTFPLSTWPPTWPSTLPTLFHTALTQLGHEPSSWPEAMSVEMLKQLKLASTSMKLVECVRLTVQEFHVRVAGGRGYVIAGDVYAARDRFMQEVLKEAAGLLGMKAERRKRRGGVSKAVKEERGMVKVDRNAVVKEEKRTVAKLMKDKSKSFAGLTSPRDTPEREFFKPEEVFGRLASPFTPLPSRRTLPTPTPEPEVRVKTEPLPPPRIPTSTLLQCSQIFPPYNREQPHRATCGKVPVLGVKPDELRSTPTTTVYPIRGVTASPPPPTRVKDEPRHASEPRLKSNTPPPRPVHPTVPVSAQNAFRIPTPPGQSPRAASSSPRSPGASGKVSKKKTVKWCKKCGEPAMSVCIHKTPRRARNRGLSLKGT